MKQDKPETANHVATLADNSVPTEEALYRRGIGVVLLDSRSWVFVGCRSLRRSAPWSMPQDAIFSDETPTAAAARHLKEAVGVTGAEVLAESSQWFQYDLPASFAAKPSAGRWRGHRQKWFAAKFPGSDDEIDISGHRSVFSMWRWVEARLVPDMAIPFKKELYRKVLDDLGLLPG